MLSPKRTSVKLFCRLTSTIWQISQAISELLMSELPMRLLLWEDSGMFAKKSCARLCSDEFRWADGSNEEAHFPIAILMRVTPLEKSPWQQSETSTFGGQLSVATALCFVWDDELLMQSSSQSSRSSTATLEEWISWLHGIPFTEI